MPLKAPSDRVESFTGGETKPTQQIARECSLSWHLTYLVLAELEREGKVVYVPSGGKITLWRMKI